MLKPKHYLHATVASAAMLTLAPLSLLLLSSLWRPAAGAPDLKFADAAVDSSRQPSRRNLTTPAELPPIFPTEDSGPSVSNNALSPHTVPSPEERNGPLRPFTDGVNILSVRAAEPASDARAPTAAVAESGPGTPLSAGTSMRPELSAEPVIIADGNAVPVAEANAEPADETLEFPKPVEVSESYFAATGHLALAHVPQTKPDDPTEDDPTKSAESTPEQEGDASPKPVKTDLIAKNSDRTKRPAALPTGRSSKLRTKASQVTADSKDAAGVSETMPVPLPTPDNAVVPDFGEDEFFGTTGRKSRTVAVGGPTATTSLVDVILQTPLETRPISRVENVIGVTSATGFPIALVRSDIPDDDWWVQQMVGMRGNTFAARVNFGNEHSISGSVYHMVIVFLDSPDEARRFRIAKRFDELPEGIRRSREFRYVRK